jgi:hypothetical protein
MEVSASELETAIVLKEIKREPKRTINWNERQIKVLSDSTSKRAPSKGNSLGGKTNHSCETWFPCV